MAHKSESVFLVMVEDRSICEFDNVELSRTPTYLAFRPLIALQERKTPHNKPAHSAVTRTTFLRLCLELQPVSSIVPNLDGVVGTRTPSNPSSR
jgi:hypothetical protein